MVKEKLIVPGAPIVEAPDERPAREMGEHAIVQNNGKTTSLQLGINHKFFGI
jgi:hypothetical protein